MAHLRHQPGWLAGLDCSCRHRAPLSSTPAPAADYAPPAFQARALQHTNVQLTWDADDDSRKRALSRKLNADELKEDDFKVRWTVALAGACF